MTTNAEMRKFLRDIVAVYKTHGLSLSHEDTHGAFLVEKFDRQNVEWLRSAHNNTKVRS